MTAETILNVAQILRETHPHMRGIFTNGGCFEFYRLAHAINPQAEAFYQGDHVYARLGNTFIDIEGAHSLDLRKGYMLTQEPRVMEEMRQCKERFWRAA